MMEGIYLVFRVTFWFFLCLDVMWHVEHFLIFLCLEGGKNLWSAKRGPSGQSCLRDSNWQWNCALNLRLSPCPTTRQWCMLWAPGLLEPGESHPGYPQLFRHRMDAERLTICSCLKNFFNSVSLSVYNSIEVSWILCTPRCSDIFGVVWRFGWSSGCGCGGGCRPQIGDLTAWQLLQLSLTGSPGTWNRTVLHSEAIFQRLWPLGLLESSFLLSFVALKAGLAKHVLQVPCARVQHRWLSCLEKASHDRGLC